MLFSYFYHFIPTLLFVSQTHHAPYSAKFHCVLYSFLRQLKFLYKLSEINFFVQWQCRNDQKLEITVKKIFFFFQILGGLRVIPAKYIFILAGCECKPAKKIFFEPNFFLLYFRIIGIGVSSEVTKFGNNGKKNFFFFFIIYVVCALYQLRIYLCQLVVSANQLSKNFFKPFWTVCMVDQLKIFFTLFSYYRHWGALRSDQIWK